MKMKGARTSLSSHLIQANMHIIITVCVLRAPKSHLQTFLHAFDNVKNEFMSRSREEINKRQFFKF